MVQLLAALFTALANLVFAKSGVVGW